MKSFYVLTVITYIMLKCWRLKIRQQFIYKQVQEHHVKKFTIGTTVKFILYGIFKFFRCNLFIINYVLVWNNEYCLIQKNNLQLLKKKSNIYDGPKVSYFGLYDYKTVKIRSKEIISMIHTQVSTSDLNMRYLPEFQLLM